MRRRSGWLPDDHEKLEPGARHGFRDGDGRRGTSPLEDILGGVALIAAAIAVAAYGAAVGATSHPGALVVMIVGALGLLGGSIYPLRRGLRRLAWRRVNARRTGQRPLRPWQRSPERGR